MPLRPVSELGLIDATDVGPEIHEREPAPSGGSAERSRSPRRSRRRASSNGAAATQTAVEVSTAPRAESIGMSPAEESNEPNDVARVGELTTVDEGQERNEVPLGDEPPTFLQIMVPGELQERLADVSYVLAAEHRELRHHKTILGALLWRYIEPDNPERLRQLGATLDAYLETDLGQAPAEIKVGAHLPFSLKYKLDGAALALRRTRRAASAKTLLSALIWRHVDTDGGQRLVELLAAYHEASRPKPLPLGPDHSQPRMSARTRTRSR
jgi:hypothetical protein